MKTKLTDAFCEKTGTNYIVVRIPKALFKDLPEAFFMDFDIKDVRPSKAKQSN